MVITLVVVIGTALELGVVVDVIVIGVETVSATSIDGEAIVVVPIVIIKLLFIGSNDVIMIVLVGLSGTGTVLTFNISVNVNTSTGVISGLVTSTVDDITADMKEDTLSVCDTVVLGIMSDVVIVCAAVSN